MARLEYDESGSTLYFVVSFYGLVLLPVTYYLWPRKGEGDRGLCFNWNDGSLLSLLSHYRHLP